jgi:pimeloyl-ACP methyl ester carboxylesterase
MSAIILSDEVVHYEVLGRGKPIVFVHGWVGSWRYWIPCMQSISTSFRSYAIDLWGFGDSAKNSELYKLEKQVDLLYDFIRKMGIDKFALVGHGLGSLVGLLYTARNSNCIDRILTVCSPIDFLDISSILLDTSPFELAKKLFSKSSSTEPILQEAPKVDPLAINYSLQNFDQYHFSEIITNLCILHLAIYGKNDPLITSFPDDNETNLPTLTHLIHFDECGHFPMLDQPRKFNRLLKDFLNLQDGESPSQLQPKDEWRRRVR